VCKPFSEESFVGRDIPVRMPLCIRSSNDCWQPPIGSTCSDACISTFLSRPACCFPHSREKQAGSLEAIHYWSPGSAAFQQSSASACCQYLLLSDEIENRIRSCRNVNDSKLNRIRLERANIQERVRVPTECEAEGQEVVPTSRQCGQSQNRPSGVFRRGQLVQPPRSRSMVI